MLVFTVPVYSMKQLIRGGIISVKTKVAPDNRVFDFTQTISGRGLFGEYLDYGERFGKNKEWGIRNYH